MECQLDNITIHYEAFGEGRPIVMLHGWPADHFTCMRYFEPVFERRSGWRRIYPDLPGMGKTSGMDWIRNQDDVLDIVLDFISHIVPGRNVSIAGYSYGGYLVQGIVYQKPALLDGVCLLTPVTANLLSDEKEHSLPRHITLVEDKALLEELEPDEAKMFQNVFVVQNRKTLDEVKDYYTRAIKLTDFEFLSRLHKNFRFTFDVCALAEPFDSPTLILTGRQDSSAGYRGAWDILENYPRATFAVLDRAGHNIPLESEILWHVLVNEWLDRVEEHSSS